MPKVSIIIPVHNTASYLKRCVDSVINQTLKDIEIILVDNLSQDGSDMICDEYALIDSRIRVLHIDKAGPSIARNAGISIASASYIGFIDSDDHIEPTMYEKLFDALVVENADMAYCNFCYEYQDGSQKHVYSNSGKIYSFTSKEILISILQDKVSSSPCTKLFKKELFDTFKFPVGIFYEDHSTVYRWVALCKKIVWVDQIYYYYLQRDGSICHNIDLKNQYDYFIAEYERLDYINGFPSFDSNDKSLLRPIIVKRCLQIFKFFMRKPNHANYKLEIKEMRKRFRKCLYLYKDINSKEYRRLIQIVFLWPIYYLLHFAFYKSKE